jgi:hypothetical protein
MELTAVLAAAKALDSPLEVVSDSRYVIDIPGSGPRWVRTTSVTRGFRRARMGTTGRKGRKKPQVTA